MFKKIIKWLLPILIVLASYAGYTAIQHAAPEDDTPPPIATAPTVTTQSILPTDHQVIISSFGELAPLEATQLSAQVSGEVTSWHPNFVAGGVVKRGEVLFTLEQDNYQAAVLQAEAQLAKAQASLIEEKAKAEVAKRQAKKLSDKQVTDLYLRKPQVLSAKAEVKSAQAGLKRARRDLDNCKVIAPYDALVVERKIGVGQYVPAGTQVATINNIEAGEVILPIAGFDSAFLPDVLEGTAANIVSNGVVTIERKGEIARDLGIVDSSTRMINLVVRIQDPYGVASNKPALKFGSYVQVHFAGKKLKHIYRLPQEMVNNRIVWVVGPDNKMLARTVNVLREENQLFLIDQGLNEGDQLVTTVPEYPQVGMDVIVANAEQDKE
ncbi:efflux RND transporter periplasmic adaptor subunit [Vibrio tapetis]|uniref:Membrane-fusion protein n=1 Tax=Vibrio tapetis subsp. tapetis TaxID=1671868 RepID=A0A2N8ZJ22_9VIBR|nr:efflux RND transporter periplasmic adaptor subunit [Vibrio tapetis]SON51900.1 Membrane-fusion protein [Vibrio tapetis subsp. tapetis]